MSTRALLLVGAASVAACNLDDVDELNYSSDSQAAYVYSGTIWGTSAIRVCWEDAMLHEPEKEVVRTWIDSTWGAETALEFFSWGSCQFPGVDQDIRIRWVNPGSLVDNRTGQTTGHGTELNNVTDGMKLVWSTPGLADTAAHEFGHAIGFGHEQTRPDTPAWCTEGDGGETVHADKTMSPWDADSIMNYCETANTGLLSSYDIDAASTLYGSQFPIGAVKQPFTRKRAKEIFIRNYGSGTSAEQYVGTRMFNTSTGTWGAWQSLQPFGPDFGWARPASGISAVAMTGPSANSTHIFYRGIYTRLIYQYKDVTGWTTPQDLGGIVVGTPLATSRDGHRKWVALVRNTNNGLSVREHNGANMLAWQNVNIVGNDGVGRFMGRPAAAADQYGALHVFLHYTDHSLRWITSPAPGNWTFGPINLGSPSLGGMLGSPTAVSVMESGLPSIYVFTRGANGYLYYSKIRDGVLQGSSFVNLGLPSTGMLGSPAVVSRGPGMLDIFVRDVNGRIWSMYRSCETCAFSGWFALPNQSYPIIGSPVATASGPHIEVYGMQKSNRRMLFMEWGTNTGNQWVVTPNFSNQLR